MWHMKYDRQVQQRLFSFSQLLTQASPVELEPVLSMYLTLLEETKSSLTFKVCGESLLVVLLCGVQHFAVVVVSLIVCGAVASLLCVTAEQGPGASAPLH